MWPEKNSVVQNELTTGSEDFSFYQQQIPGLFFFLGVAALDKDPQLAAANHSNLFLIDDAALKTGVRAMSNLAVEYLEQNK